MHLVVWNGRILWLPRWLTLWWLLAAIWVARADANYVRATAIWNHLHVTISIWNERLRKRMNWAIVQLFIWWSSPTFRSLGTSFFPTASFWSQVKLLFRRHVAQKHRFWFGRFYAAQTNVLANTRWLACASFRAVFSFLFWRDVAQLHWSWFNRFLAARENIFRKRSWLATPLNGLDGHLYKNCLQAENLVDSEILHFSSNNCLIKWTNVNSPFFRAPSQSFAKLFVVLLVGRFQ